MTTTIKNNGAACTNSTAPTGLTTTTPVICNGSSVTLTVAGGSLGTAASWKVYDGGCGSGTAVATSSSSTITFTPTAGAHTYYVRAEGTCNTTACQTIPCYVFANAPSASITLQNPTSCTSNGTIQFAQVSGGASLWLNSDFSSNPGTIASCSSASVTGGECILTSNSGSQTGSLTIANSANFNATAFRVEYDQRIFDGSAADGMSWNYGDFSTTPGCGGGEGGIAAGTNVLSFRCTTYSGAGGPLNRIYYNGVQVGANNTTLMRSAAYKHIIIAVNAASQITVNVDGVDLWTNLQLPAGYISANKTGWNMAWTARTGGATDKHSIDNLRIIALDQYEYTINNGGAFTSGTAANQTFTGLAVGNTYAAGTVYLRSKAGAGSVCNGSSNGSAMTVAVPYSPIPAPTAAVSTATTCSGNTVTLTASGLAPGRGGSNGTGAYQFTATSSQYLFTNTLTGFPTGSVASAEAWIKPNATQYDGTYNGIISFGPNPAACYQRFLLSMGSDGRITFANWCNDYYSVGSVPFGVWSHVAAVLNGTTLTIYINGKVAGTTTLGVTPALVASGQFTVGCTDPGGGRFFNGEIDAVRIWNTARSAAQIQADMYLEAPTNATGLVARYNLNGTFNAQVGPNLTASASAPTATTPAFHTYTWSGASPSGSNPSSSTLEVQTSGALTGNSSFTVTPSANTCSGTASSAQAVTVNAIPAAVSVSGGGTACGSTTLTASGGAGGTIYWQGTTSGGTSTATASTSQTVSASGTYYFRSYNGSCWGAEGSAVVTITTVPSAVTVSGAGTFCGSTTITASGGTPGTIYWQGTTSGGTSTATASSSQTITSNGTYYFRANNAGCWGPEGSAAVTINPVPAAVTVNTPGTYCGSTTLTATGGSGGTIYWQGTTSGGTSTATPTTSQSVSATGTYYFRSCSAAGCWGTQGSAAVTIQNNTYGDFSCNPIVVGGLCVGGSYSDTRNNGSYANDYVGQGSGDIYYQFTLPFAATVNVSHCGSGFDTYLYLLNSSGGVVASNDDDGALCSGTAASVSVALSAGTYYVVSEGYSTNTGNITTTISLATTPSNPGTTDNQNQQGIGSWLGQVYDGTTFNTFLGTTTEPATFDETFGGDNTCFPIGYNNNAGTYSVFTDGMSIRYRMIKDFPCGAYTFTAGSDDGLRLWVNGVLVLDYWLDRGYTTNSTSPIYLYGPTSLQLEYYEGSGGNRCSFTYSSTPVNILGSVNVGAQPSTCGGNGTINLTPSSGSATLWYNNDMNYSIPRGSQTLTSASLYSFNYNTPTSKDSWLGLTTNGGSQNGSLVINNQYSLNATSFRTEFDLYIGGGTGADGLSLSYGPDVAAGGGCNGTGSGIRLVFDTYNNAGSPCQGVQGGNVGIGMFYGGFSLGQQYACNTSNNIRNAWKHCVFTVNSSGVGTLTIDGIGSIFSAALPAAYLAVTDKTAWKWAATASTGGAYDYHAIDNLVISAYDQYEYSADGSTWQSSTSFTKPAGSYTLYARNKSGECVSTLGTATIYDPTPPSPPTTTDVTVQVCSNGATSTISVNTPPTNVVTDWYSTPTGGSPISGGTAVNSITVTPGTYYAEARNTVTLCKSTTRTAISLVINPIPAAPTSGGNITACNGTSGTLSATPPGSPSGTIIDWYTTGGTLLSASSNTYTTSTAGTYVAVSQSPAGCSSNPGTNITLTVLSALNYGTVSNTGETICNNGDPASFGFSTAPSGGTGSFSYQWYYKDGVNTAPTGTTFPNGWNIIGGATSNSYNPPAGLTTTRTYACGVDATGSPDCAPMTWAAGQWTVTVRPDAVATISGTTTVCQNDASPAVTFSNSTALPITVTYNVNGGSNQTINIAASSTATVSQVTTAAGTFAYNLVSAVFQTAPTCTNALSGSATVTVRPTPTPSISGTTTVCAFDAAPLVTFTNPQTLPVTITYNVNGGSNQTINVAASSSATVSQATSTAGTFTYNLVSVVYQSGPTCSSTASGSAAITVRPKLDATISGNTTVCQGATAPNVTFTNPQALPITITYNVNGGSNQTINVPASSSATVAVSTATPGTFVYTVVSGVYQTAPSCPNTIGGVVTVNVHAPVVLTSTATPNPVCYGNTLTLNASVTQGTGITAWSWTGPGGFTASTQNTSRGSMQTGASYEGVYYVSATNVCGASTPQPTSSVVVNPEITANVVIDECVSVGPDNYYMLVTASGGVAGYTFTSPKFVVSSDKAVYEVGAGNTEYFTITDATSCAITVPGTAPAGHPMDIALSSTTGSKTVNCYDVNLNKWLTFRDDATNEAILSINDNNQDLGQVNVTVYKDAAEPATYTTGNNCLDFTDFKALKRHFMVTTANAPTGPVGVRLYFTQDEANALHAASIGNNLPGNSCTENDDFNDVSGLTDLYVTKYTGLDEDGDYTNNHAAGLYRVFGNANGFNTPDGPLAKGPAGFGTLFNGATDHHYVQLTVTEFSEFWLNGSYHAQALPVEMIFLEANAIDNSYIQLTWATAIEVNNKGFQVERSLDGQTWSTIGWVDGHDNSTVQQNYSYNDMDVTPNVRYYYRLKQVDFDGAFEYTDLVTAIITQQSTFNVKDFVPNPTLNNTSLIVTSTTDQEIDVVFYNLVGEIVNSGKHNLHKGGNQISFNLSELAAGTYTAVVTSNNEVYSKKVVVIK